MRVEPQQLKVFMMDAGLIKESQFNEALKQAEKQKKKVEDVLVSEGLISLDDLIRLQAYILGIPFVNLENQNVELGVLKIIPEPLARSHNIIAFRKKGKNLEVAMLNPDDLQTIEFVKKKVDLRILPRLTNLKSIKNVLSQYQQNLRKEFNELIREESEEMGKIEQEGTGTEKEAKNFPIIIIAETLLKHAILQGATDIHIEPLENEILIRYRINGILREAMVLPPSVKMGIIERIKTLSNLKSDEHKLPQEGKFKIGDGGNEYSCRVSILPVFNGEKIVIRIFPEAIKNFTLEGLGLFGKNLEKVEKALKKQSGIILIVGPLGSGKTTTLYSIMEILNTPDKNISTIEDPIEYRIPRTNQTQVNQRIGLTFAFGLRSLLTQDPDILIVGEIRDKETAVLAANVASSGRLVISTLSVNSSAEAVSFLLNMGVEPLLLSSTLKLVLGQKLVRKISGENKKFKLKDEEKEILKKCCDLKTLEKILKEEKIFSAKQTIEDFEFFRTKPEEDHKGRTGVFEVLEISEPIKELIGKQAISDEIQARAQKEGMNLMIEDGFIKAARGIISIEEVLAIVAEKN